MQGKNRYFRCSRLSEAKFRLIMRYFTHDLPASKLAALSDVSRPTINPGTSPFFAQPEMGFVRFRVQTMGRRPLPSAARVRPDAHSARHQDSRNDLTPCRMTWHFVSAGARAPYSDQTLGPIPTPGRRTPARRLPSLASLCSSNGSSSYDLESPSFVTPHRLFPARLKKMNPLLAAHRVRGKKGRRAGGKTIVLGTGFQTRRADSAFPWLQRWCGK